MAFNAQEQEIIKAGISAGKSKDEVSAALTRYRTGKGPVSETPAPAPESGPVAAIKDVPSDIGEGFKSILDSLGQMVATHKEAATQAKAGELSFPAFISKITGAAGHALSGVEGEGLLTLGKLFTSPATERKVGDFVETSVGPVAKDVIQSEPVQALMKKYETASPETKAYIDGILGTAEGLTTTLGAGLAKKAVTEVGEAGYTAAKTAISDLISSGKKKAIEIISEARPATQKLISGATELVRPAPTAEKALGEVLQGTKPLTMRDVNAFKNIDIAGVDTYSGLKTNIDTSIENLSNKVDAVLAQDSSLHKLDELVTKTSTKGGKTIETNYVKTALDNLKEFYSKIADPVGEAGVDDLLVKANSEGLTRLEVNDISRLYNVEFGEKAFNKIGEPLTSVNAQAYENIRKGLKDVARLGMGGEEAKATDKIISSLYNVRGLVQKNVAAVQRLEQKIAERGLLEKIGHGVAKYGDILTGGSLRSFVGGLLPRGAGYKVLNALDLEERLASNLKIIKDAIESGSDDILTKNVKKVEALVSPGK